MFERTFASESRVPRPRKGKAGDGQGATQKPGQAVGDAGRLGDAGHPPPGQR